MTSLIKISKSIFIVILLSLLAAGIYFRFVGVKWNQGTDLHPDEYGLTNTLTQLSSPKSISEYFNTRISPISPYQKYDISGTATINGPDNRMRWGQWPLILIRGVAELANKTSYDDLRILGRTMAACADSLSVLLILIIGLKLYGFTIGLLGATLSSLAVLQIQQSHFMTVDNFGVFFVMLSLFAAVQIARHPPLKVVYQHDQKIYRINWKALKWYLLFGVGFGMAISSKINLIPLGGMILSAAFISIADLKLFTKKDLEKIFSSAFFFMMLAFIVTLLTFRICQPMSFRAKSGDTTFLTTHFNQDWGDSMKEAQLESSGGIASPPAEQWTDRPAIIFPLINMVFWGVGLPLGIAAWGGFIWAAWQTFRYGRKWQAHLLPVIWVGGYFLFMSTRWVKSIRYFLPIYPFLCLLAAWGLVEIFRCLRSSEMLHKAPNFVSRLRYLPAVLSIVLVVGGTFIWASSFVNTVYLQEHTRIQATKWISQNIPAPIHLQINQNGENSFLPISVPDGQPIFQNSPFVQSFSSTTAGKLTSVTLPHIKNIGEQTESLLITISTDPEGSQVLDQIEIMVSPSSNTRGVKVQVGLNDKEIEAGKVYFLTASTLSTQPLQLFRNVISVEEWDEPLPVRFGGYDPFGMFYQGITMNVRWADNETKRAMYLNNLENVDYIIVPSQRSIWSVCRLPLMYPMTLKYYRALFNGNLGFEQAAQFQATFNIGPLKISDAAGTFASNSNPEIPLFNFNPLAAEEAFSVYDHPPVWIFKKNEGFSMEKVRNIIDSVDLSQVVIQSPKTTKVNPIN